MVLQISVNQVYSLANTAFSVPDSTPRFETPKLIRMEYTQGNTPFFKDVVTTVHHYFKDQQMSKLGNRSMLIKGSIIVGTYIACYNLLLFGNFSLLTMQLIAIVMGMCGVLTVFNIVHDASHNAIFTKKRLNKLTAYLGDLMGINTYIWDIRHNVQHHHYTNVLGGDIIIENVPLVRLSEHQKHFWFHRYQRLYAPFLYMFYSFYWIFVIDFKLFFTKDICNLHNIVHPRKEWLKLFLFKSFYITYSIIIPILVTDLLWYQVVIGFLVMHAAAGVLLSTVAVLGHFVEGPVFPAPNESGQLDTSWGDHELDATIDFANTSRFAHWFTGGLNTHIPHHLFPGICHIHYYELVKVIQGVCEKHGKVYQQESFWHALASHFRYLKRLSYA